MDAPEPGRLARAVHSFVTETGPRRWRVTGGVGEHVVQLGADGGVRCDCTDYAVNGGRIACRHVLAVRLHLGNTDALDALRQIVPLPKRHRKPRVA